MIVCDRCGQGFDFISFIGGVALCGSCVKVYDSDLLRCYTRLDYVRLACRIRAEVLGPSVQDQRSSGGNHET
jgi:hypothetical protein